MEGRYVQNISLIYSKSQEAERICSMLDYDFEEKGKKMESMAGLFGALEVAQRQYDLAAVVNLGCGL